ncbi:helix-turn-helix domain-containing protein [Bradyrhizobium sp. NAS80.1]|uniref:helix-turn-helix domain-containing protein n=1 Tax=Bradyrhizobium sp. NAS80.1 TaxID=1680159 RepID=UPI0009FDE36A|nr:helix-turn-helix domain-containing protein [Bradyrhizobium sp. NAS80.1]
MDQQNPSVSRQIAALEPHHLAPLAFTIAEACQVARVGRSNLSAAIHSGALRARKLGVKTLILRDDLRVWLETFPLASSSDSSTGTTRAQAETVAAPARRPRGRPLRRRVEAVGEA